MSGSLLQLRFQDALVLFFCFVNPRLRRDFSVPCLNADPRGGRWPASAQCLPAEPGLPECWIVLRETPVPLPTPSTPHKPRCPLLPSRVELARHLRHDGPQRWGYCQRYCLPRILQSLRVSGGGCPRNQQGTSEWPPSLSWCLFRKLLDALQDSGWTAIYT